MKTKEIKVLMVEPGKHPRVSTLANDLDSLQKAVSIKPDYQEHNEIISIGNCFSYRWPWHPFGIRG